MQTFSGSPIGEDGDMKSEQSRWTKRLGGGLREGEGLRDADLLPDCLGEGGGTGPQQML